MEAYEHYIRLNGDIIVHGFSTAFEQPQGGDILIAGQMGRHFTVQLTNSRGQFLYRYNGSITLRSQAELDAEWAARPIQKTPDQLENEQLNLSIIEIWESIIPLLPE